MNEFTNLIESNAYNLKNIYRYSNCKFINPESTAEHTILMQLLGFEIYNKLLNENHVEFDIRELLYRVFLHDLDETVMCDIPRDIKYFSEESHKLINDIASVKLRESGINSDVITQIEDAKHNCIEGELAAYLDVLQAVIKIREEYNLQVSRSIKLRYIDSTDTLYDKCNNFNYINEINCPYLYSYLIKITNDTMEIRIGDLNG